MRTGGVIGGFAWIMLVFVAVLCISLAEAGYTDRTSDYRITLGKKAQLMCQISPRNCSASRFKKRVQQDDGRIGSRPTSTIELLEALRNLRNRYQSSNTRVFYDADAVNPGLLESEHMAKLYRR